MTSLITIASQIGGSILADNASHENRIEIRSESSNRIYIVAQSRSTGEWQCSCPGWTMKKNGKERTCKHLQAILPNLSKPVAKLATKAEEAKPVKKPAAPRPPKKEPEPVEQPVALQEGKAFGNVSTLADLAEALKELEHRGVEVSKLPKCVRNIIEISQKMTADNK